MKLNVYPFEFKKYRTKSDRLTCPGCGRNHSLVPYVLTATGEELPERFGRCNRVDSCGYHLKPTMKDLNIEDQQWETYMQELASRPEKPNVIVDLPSNLLLDSLSWNEENTLYKYLIKLLPANVVKWLFEEYLVGNHPVWPGAVVFWFVTILGQIRAGQVKQFECGHTVKKADKEGRTRSRTIWIHALFNDEPPEWLQPYLDQKTRCDCLYGEHLLAKYPNKWVAIFESPKTAILASAHFPDAVCLAVGALDYLTYDRLKVLKGRKVIFYPDLSKNGTAFASWSEKAERFKSITDFKVSRILEGIASDEDRIKGLDMADYLEKIPYSLEATTDNEPVKENIRVATESFERSNSNGVIFRETAEETYRWENGAQNFTEFQGSADANCLVPGSQSTTERAPSDYFDINEHFLWMKLLTPLNKGESIRIRSSEYPVCNLRLFIKSRLEGISAWRNGRTQGDGPLFTRQIQELREIITNRTSNQS